MQLLPIYQKKSNTTLLPNVSKQNDISIDLPCISNINIPRNEIPNSILAEKQPISIMSMNRLDNLKTAF